MTTDTQEDAPAPPPRSPTMEFVHALAKELSEGTIELPPFPDIALRVRNALNADDAGTEKISRIVLSEPVLAARLVRLANSAMLRRGGAEITDVRTAVSRLGFDMIRNVTVSWAVDKAFPTPLDAALKRQIEQTRRHSVTVAAIAWVLAGKRRGAGISPDEAMLAGLLHDLGRFYIFTRIRAYPELTADAATMDKLLGDWHTGVGRAIVESWNFTEAVQIAVEEHDVLDRDHPGKADLGDIVLVANLLSHTGYMDPAQVSALPAARKLELDEASIADIVAESEQEIRSMAQALGS